MEIKLDSRLNAIYNYIRENRIIADIGTDHGYLPIYALQNKKASFAFCCDVNPMPLQNAVNLINQFSMQKQTKAVISNGLENLKENCCDDIIIAGMGFDLIINILSSCKWIKNKDINLILQPMTGHENVRKYLFENNYKISDETAVFDENKIYTIICCHYDEKPILFNEVDLFLGSHLRKAKKGDSLSKKYINTIVKKLENIVLGLEKSKNKNDEIEKTKNLIIKIKNEI
ncbi:MAG: class I SAM-dependent methyltransferase [Clostridia bacterium]